MWNCWHQWQQSRAKSMDLSCQFTSVQKNQWWEQSNGKCHTLKLQCTGEWEDYWARKESHSVKLVNSELWGQRTNNHHCIKDFFWETSALPGLFYLLWENPDLEGVLAWPRTTSKSGRPSGFNIHIGLDWNCNKKSLSYVSFPPSCRSDSSSRSGKDDSVEMEVTYI